MAFEFAASPSALSGLWSPLLLAASRGHAHLGWELGCQQHGSHTAARVEDTAWRAGVRWMCVRTPGQLGDLELVS